MNSLCKNLEKTFPGLGWQVSSDGIISFTTITTFTITKGKDDLYLIEGSKYRSVVSIRRLFSNLSKTIKRSRQVQSLVDRLNPLLELFNITPTIDYYGRSSMINFNFGPLSYIISQNNDRQTSIFIFKQTRYICLPLNVSDQDINKIKIDLITVLSNRDIQKDFLEREYLCYQQQSKLFDSVCIICNQQTDLLLKVLSEM